MEASQFAGVAVTLGAVFFAVVGIWLVLLQSEIRTKYGPFGPGLWRYLQIRYSSGEHLRTLSARLKAMLVDEYQRQYSLLTSASAVDIVVRAHVQAINDVLDRRQMDLASRSVDKVMRR